MMLMTLVKAIKSKVKIPVQLHTHYTAGLASMTALKAVEAGVDVIDTAISPMAMGTSQPPTEPLVATFAGTPFDTGLDLKKLDVISKYFTTLREKYLASGLSGPQGHEGQRQRSSVSGTGRNAFEPCFSA